MIIGNFQSGMHTISSVLSLMVSLETDEKNYQYLHSSEILFLLEKDRNRNSFGVKYSGTMCKYMLVNSRMILSIIIRYLFILNF